MRPPLIAAGLSVGLVFSGTAGIAAGLYETARAAIGSPRALVAISTMAIQGERRFRSPLDSDMPTGRLRLFFAPPDRFLRAIRPDARAIGMLHMPGTALNGFIGDRQVSRIENPSPGESLRKLTEPEQQAWVGRLKLYATGILVASLLSTDTPLPLTYAHGGVAESPDGRADVLDARTPDGLLIRVLLDQTTHRVLMLMPSKPLVRRPIDVDERGERWFVTDYRKVGSLTLPHLIVIEAKGQTVEVWQFEQYRLNAPVPADLAK